MKRERVFTSLRRFTLHKSAPLHTTRNEAHKWLWEHSRRRPSGCWAANHAAPPCSRHRATPFRRRPARQTGEKAVSPLQGLQACMGGAMGKAHAREAGGQGTCCSGRVRVRMDRVHAWDCLEDGGTRVAALHATRELASGCSRGGWRTVRRAGEARQPSKDRAARLGCACKVGRISPEEHIVKELEVFPSICVHLKLCSSRQRIRRKRTCSRETRIAHERELSGSTHCRASILRWL